MNWRFWKSGSGGNRRGPFGLILRGFAAARTDRLLSGWSFDGGYTAQEIAGQLATIRALSRDMAKNSPHFKRDLPELLDVPGRDQILIHAGNYVSDSKGCILVGLLRDVYRCMLSNSRAALEIVLDALAGCDGFTLTLKGVEA